jgi:hypothetical protein
VEAMVEARVDIAAAAKANLLAEAGPPLEAAAAQTRDSAAGLPALPSPSSSQAAIRHYRRRRHLGSVPALALATRSLRPRTTTAAAESGRSEVARRTRAGSTGAQRG